MKFILILTVWMNAGPTSVAVVPIPFETRIACETAGQQFVASNRGNFVAPARYACAATQ